MICDMTSFDQLRDLKTSDLTLTRGQDQVDLTVASPEQKVHHSTCLSEANTMMPKSRLWRPFFAVTYEKVNLCPGSLDLTSEVTG